MLVKSDLYKVWDIYKPFEEFQVLSVEYYKTPFDKSSTIYYKKGSWYTCYRVGSSDITFKTGEAKDGSNDSMMWDKFIKHFDIPELSREHKLNNILT